MSIELAEARKRKSPAFTGLLRDFVLLVGACWEGGIQIIAENVVNPGIYWI
jgi:hypothetical protein